MIFKLNKNDINSLDKLLQTKDYNNEIADYLNENIINNVLEDIDLDKNKINRLNQNNYINNSYYKNVTPKEIKFNNYEIKYLTYKPNQCFIYQDIEVNENDYYLTTNKIGCFIKEYKYLSINKDNTTWMSVIPHEINTMNINTKLLTKHIYVFGLGLGYFPYIYENKVDKITIIEKDKTIIELFKKYLFPYFNNKDKYEIINDDAFNYINKIDKNDFIFVDLWHDVNDGLFLFIKMFKKLKEHNNVIYWIKKSLLSAIRNLLINLIEEEYYHPYEFNYDKAKNEIDELINKLHHYLINKKISSYLEIKELLSDNSLEDLILNI